MEGILTTANTNYVGNLTVTPDYTYSYGTTLITNNNHKMNVAQTKVAVFEITRNNKNEVISSKFIKEIWVETKNGSSIDFEVAKDKEISKFPSESISIKTITTIYWN